MNPTNLLIGSLISFAVSGLKKLPFVSRYPKVVTAVLSTAIPAGIAVYGQIKGVEVAPVQDLVAQAATQFAAAIGTHETVTHTVNKIADQ